MPFRPKTLAEVAARAASLPDWGAGLAEFLDETNAWRKSGDHARLAAAVYDEPALLRSRFDSGSAADAFGAALAEYLAELTAIVAPAWTRNPERFLEHPWYPLPHIAAHPRLQALLEAQTPEPFRRHNIFIDENSLVRV